MEDSAYTNRIALFESIQNEQNRDRLKLPTDLIKVTLLDGEVKEGNRWKTTPFDIANEISEELASNALVAKVNGVLWDMNRPLGGDCKLELFTFDSDEGRDTFWHSSAHILGQTLERLFGCSLCKCSCTERGEGFYYDAFCGDLELNEDHLNQIEAAAIKAEKHFFERIKVTREQALAIFSDNKFKVAIIEGKPEDEAFTIYRCGFLVDLCCGPHIPNTSFVKAFSCLKAEIVGSDDEISRVLGISYPDRESLEEYNALLEEAIKQELFYFLPLSPRSYVLSHGVRVYQRLMDFFGDLYVRMEYNVGKEHHFGIYSNETALVYPLEEHAFRVAELPFRLADSELLAPICGGFTRFRRFQQDNARIYCCESQIRVEVQRVLMMMRYVYKIFGFTFDLKLSTRPMRYFGDPEAWIFAEAALEEALKKFGNHWEKNEAGGAFHGPSIDICLSDATGREIQCAHLQINLNKPGQRSGGLASPSEVETRKSERIVCIHVAIFGSVAQICAILLQQHKAEWPFYFSPRQILVCSVAKEFEPNALQVQKQLTDAGFYADVDTSDNHIKSKEKDAMGKYFCILSVDKKYAAHNHMVNIRAMQYKIVNKKGSIEELLRDFNSLVDQTLNWMEYED